MTKRRTTQHLMMAGSALLSMATGTTALAQSTADSGFALEEITITATKRETSLQETPMTVTAVDGEDIQKSGRTSLTQILENVAGVQGSTAGAFGTYFWVRGVGSSPTFGQDAAVTTSMNGVFMQTSQSARGTFYDVDRVEVARGPQSTLTGRNSLGGSITVIGAEPTFDNEASATVGYGSNNLLNGQGTLNAPIFGDTVAVRASVSTEKRDGWISNGTNDSDVLAGRLRVRFGSGENFKLILTGETSKTGGLGTGTAETGLIIPNQLSEYSLGRYCRTVTECANAVALNGANAIVATSAFNDLPMVPDYYTSFRPTHMYNREYQSKAFYADLNWNLGFAKMYFQPTYSTSDSRDLTSGFSMTDYALWSERVYNLHGPTPPATSTGANATQCGVSGTICQQWSVERQEALARALAYSIDWNFMQQRQKSAELRFSSPDGSKLQWLGGLFFLNNAEKVRVGMTAAPASGMAVVGQYGTDVNGGPLTTSYCVTPNTPTPTTPPNPALPYGSGCTATSIPNDAVAVIQSPLTDASVNDVTRVIRRNIDPSRYTRDKAIYGQVSYPLTDKLDLTVGGRYTKEEKHRNAEPLRTTYVADDGVPGQSSANTPGFQRSAPMAAQDASWDIVDFRATLDYQLTPDNMVYGSISSGFRGGSFLNLPVDANNVMLPGFQNYYDPERLISYEIGTRNDLFDKRLRLNASAYYYDYTDYQYQYAAIVYVGQDPDATLNYTTNVGNASIMGLDMETRFLLTPADELVLNATYLDAKLGKLTLPGGTATAQAQANALKDAPLRRSPKWALSPAYRHQFSLGSWGTLTAGADMHWESKSLILDASPVPGVNALITQKAYHKSNITLSYDSADGKFNITAAARNIEDETTFGTLTAPAGTSLNANLTSLTLDPGEPRTYGVTMTAKF